jgi:signal transduction histidine kinase
MLMRNQSLAVRAAVIFVSIYAAMLLAGLILLSLLSLSSGGERHHAGPRVALTFAADQIVRREGSLVIPVEGSFGRLAERNPSLWVLADGGGQRFSYGPVPSSAEALFEEQLRTVQAANFHVPGVARPLSDAAMERVQFGSQTVALAVGGVHPDSVTIAETFRYFLGEGLFVIVLLLTAYAAVATFVGVPLLARALKPLAADAAAIQPDEPSRRIREAAVPRELLPLVRGFNMTLDRLAGEMLRRRRFIADIAHELKTPLSILSLQVEALSPGEAKRDVERLVGRLSRLVSQMLDVERLPLAPPDPVTIELGALAGDAVEEMAPMAIAEGYELALVAPPRPVPVEGDPHSLGRAVANLIGNAIAHSGGKGRISVVVSEERTLDVIDEGPGVAASVRDSLFEPFARERWDRDGCGLGLHLTREIMRAHGGDAVLLPTPSGAAFRLVFARGHGDALKA